MSLVKERRNLRGYCVKLLEIFIMLNQQKQTTLKSEIQALATELKEEKHVVDRNPSKLEVTGRCDGFEKKPRMTTQNRQKLHAENK